MKKKSNFIFYIVRYYDKLIINNILKVLIFIFIFF